MSTQRGWLYKPDGTIEQVTPKNRKEFTYKEINKMLGGGGIESIPYADPAFCVFCNQDPYTDLPANENATEIFIRQNELMRGWLDRKSPDVEVTPEGVIIAGGGPDYKLEGNIIKLDAVGGWSTGSEREAEARKILNDIEKIEP